MSNKSMKYPEDKDLDLEAIDKISENCSISDYYECRRLLKKQNNELIQKIYYELMYDIFGNETDFIPMGCSYSKLCDILLKLGGKCETFGEKSRRKARNEINKYEKRIKELKEKLEELQESSITTP